MGVAKAAALAGAAALAAAASGSAGTPPRPFVAPLRVLSAERARFVHTPPPASNGPALGAEQLVFLNPRLGYAATTGGAGHVPKTGWHRPSEPGRIQLTTDGGRSWRTLWSGRRVVFDSIVFHGPQDGVALANVIEPGVRDYGPEPPARPLVLATRDAGATWHRVRPPFTHLLAQIQPVSASLWFAVSEPPSYVEGAFPALRRTTDRGRSWRSLPLPRRPQTVRFATRKLGFAGATGSSCPKLSQLWRTNDGGRTWRPIPGTCGPRYVNIDVVTRHLVFAAQSYGPEDIARGRNNRILRTRGSGRTWELVPSDPKRRWPALSRVAFADAKHGWAVSSEYDQGFIFDALHVTSDGGRTWRERPFPALPTAFVGARYAWAGADGVWRTGDRGHSWTVSTRPRRLGAYELDFATRRAVAVETLGTAWSRNRGRTWSFRRPVSPREAARAMGETAYLDVHDLDSAAPFISADHGRTWHRLQLPRSALGIGDVAFTDAKHGLLASGQGDFGRVPVFATADGGASWRRVKMPPAVGRDFEANLGPGVIVVPSALDPPHVNLAALSVDGGSHWQTFPLKADFWDCDAARPSPSTVWVSCSQSVSRGASVHFVSHDGGRSWRKLVVPVQLDEHVAVVGEHEAWAIGNRYGRSPGTIWHTDDDGRAWHQVWVDISARARYFAMERSPRMG